jgi:hypothetical protein
MNPNKVELSNLNKSFEYEKIARDIDSISDIDELKNLAKSYIKLYLKQQEVLSELKWPNPAQDKN